MAKSLSHEKVQVVLADGFEYLKNTAAKDEADKYDVIVTDSSDPDGPAEAFFQKQYFELLYNALNANGIVISMASENIWLNIDKLKSLKDICSQVFAVTECCYCTIPTYTSGQIALMCCSKNPHLKVSAPHRMESRDREAQLFRYYNAAIHSASFVLPRWAADKLNGQNRADLGDKTHQRKAKSQVLAQLHHRVESVVARRQNALQQIINHCLELLFFSLHQLRRLRGAERARLEFGEMQSRELKRGQLSLARDLVDVDAQLQHRAQAPVQNVEVLPPQRRPVLIRVPVVHQVRDLVLVQQRRLHPG
ncbi:hypothetical protein KL909_001124 [Ogataea angusta]|nr:hypothetical protein KL909_001124 [Ogataea angusta]